MNYKHATYLYSTMYTTYLYSTIYTTYLYSTMYTTYLYMYTTYLYSTMYTTYLYSTMYTTYLYTTMYTTYLYSTMYTTFYNFKSFPSWDPKKIWWSFCNLHGHSCLHVPKQLILLFDIKRYICFWHLILKTKTI